MEETWRAVAGWEGFYEVSSEGRVRSLTRESFCASRTGRIYTRSLKGRILRSRLCVAGRPQLSLCKEGVHHDTLISHLVAEAFLGLRPEGKQVCHVNGCPADNRPSNLYYGTPKQNAADCTRHKTRASVKGEANPRSVLTEDQVRNIRKLRGSAAHAMIGKAFGVSPQTICDIYAGRRWSHVS